MTFATRGRVGSGPAPRRVWPRPCRVSPRPRRVWPRPAPGAAGPVWNYSPCWKSWASIQLGARASPREMGGAEGTASIAPPGCPLALAGSGPLGHCQPLLGHLQRERRTHWALSGCRACNWSTRFFPPIAAEFPHFLDQLKKKQDVLGEQQLEVG